MALDTKVVKIGSAADIQPGVFSPAEFGAAEFPKVQAAIEKRAVDASELYEALSKDKDAAAKNYGVAANSGYVFSVKFTGVAGKPDFGAYPVVVEGVPRHSSVTVQTGPAIFGADLRDGSGEIAFGQFVNQIDYQNAGAALNKEMKKQVLAKIDTAHLEGKTHLGRRRLRAGQSERLARHAGAAGRQMSGRQRADDEVVLAARDIAKTFGSTHALKGVNFEVRRGKVTTLFGENGAGKSTLMKILAGILTPTSGHHRTRRRARRLFLQQRRARARRLDHPSGTEPRAQPERARQHLHGPRDRRRRRASISPRRRGGPSR